MPDRCQRQPVNAACRTEENTAGRVLPDLQVLRPVMRAQECSSRAASAPQAAAAAAAGGEAPRATSALLAAMSDAVAAGEAFASADCGRAAVRAAAVAVELGARVQGRS